MDMASYAGKYPAPWYPGVGDRIRTRTSPECPATHYGLTGILGQVTDAENFDQDYIPDPNECDPEEHRLNYEAWKMYQGHLYWVEFDDRHPIPESPYYLKGDFFAAVELEPEGEREIAQR